MEKLISLFFEEDLISISFALNIEELLCSEEKESFSIVIRRNEPVSDVARTQYTIRRHPIKIL
tara:strand:- start:412 stop:600 length:189 start_codon:yes stop_codon:yes gene_type:complete